MSFKEAKQIYETTKKGILKKCLQITLLTFHIYENVKIKYLKFTSFKFRAII